MHTGQRNPFQIPEEEQYDKNFFPPLISSNNFARIDFEAHIYTKSDYSINHVFKTTSVAALNTLYKICKVERTQLLIILAITVKIRQLAGFLIIQNRSNFFYVAGSTSWFFD